MSRLTGDVKIMPSPAVKFIEWMNPSEKNGVENPGFHFYDKEKETNVSVEFPFLFQYLEDAIGIGGYLKTRKKYIHSNEILNTYETPLDIKIWEDKKEEILKSGFYYVGQTKPASQMTENELKDWKAKVSKDGKNGTLVTLPKSVTGAKKCKILYLLVNDEVWRMKLEGGKMTAWDDFQKQANPNKWKNDDRNVDRVISWYETELKVNDKGGEDYNVPKFKYLKATEEQNQNALNVYIEQVKPYFDYLLNDPKEDEKELVPIKNNVDASY